MKRKRIRPIWPSGTRLWTQDFWTIFPPLILIFTGGEVTRSNTGNLLKEIGLYPWPCNQKHGCFFFTWSARAKVSPFSINDISFHVEI